MNDLISMSEQERQLYFEQSSAATGFSEVVIEKDFWVCVVLRELFNLPDVGQYLTFKGGTSLSKGFSIIDHFSEDIDIVINREYLGFEGELGSKKRKRLMKVCKEIVSNTISPRLEATLNKLIPDNQTWELVPASIDVAL